MDSALEGVGVLRRDLGDTQNPRELKLRHHRSGFTLLYRFLMLLSKFASQLRHKIRTTVLEKRLAD